MKYTILADAGSTKIDWCRINNNTGEILNISTSGINALTSSETQIFAVLQEVSERFKIDSNIDKIYFYGSGCSTPILSMRVRNLISGHFRLNPDDIHIYSDLLGAAHSLLGNSSGIVCILGTGSNSCYFNGTEIEEHTPSLGYILGDEGSGAKLGMRLVSDAFKGHLPQDITAKFIQRFNLDMDTILENVYRQPAPNKYLASFVPFIAQHLYNPYIYALVFNEFNNFITRNLMLYSKSLSTTINFTGSIAYYFADILRDACDSQNLKIGKISKAPIEGLVEYYKNMIIR